MRMSYMNEAPMIIREFCGYMETIKGKSTGTVEGYYIDLRSFFRYIKLSRGLVDKKTDFKKISILDVDLSLVESVKLTDVFEFLNYTANVRSNNGNTRSRKCSSLRAFYHYLYSTTSQIRFNPVEELSNPKIPKRLPKYLDVEQSIDLLSSVDGEFKQRDYCILTLFLNCGMRLSELVGINLSDIRSDGSLRITGKGNKQRLIYLNQACLDAIEAYKRVRPINGVIDRDALFLSKRKQRISPKTVQYLVKKYLTKINLDKGYSVHKLRHTAATLMYQHGNADTRVLKDILGHENLNTTEIYTHLSSRQMKDAIEANPLSRVNLSKDVNNNNDE